MEYVNKIVNFFDLHLKNMPQLRLMDAAPADENGQEIKQSESETTGQDGWQAAS